MRPLGRTYLIQIEDRKDQIIAGGIILPQQNKRDLIHYVGKIVQTGLGFSGDNEVGKNDTVIFDWTKKKGKVKIFLDQKMYYIVEEDLILALKTE